VSTFILITKSLCSIHCFNSCGQIIESSLLQLLSGKWKRIRLNGEGMLG